MHQIFFNAKLTVKKSEIKFYKILKIRELAKSLSKKLILRLITRFSEITGCKHFGIKVFLRSINKIPILLNGIRKVQNLLLKFARRFRLTEVLFCFVFQSLWT